LDHRQRTRHAGVCAMTRPGDRLRRVAARFCNRSAMERLIDPAVADLQAEYQAVQTASAWTRVWTLLRGYTACLKVIALCACSGARTGLSWVGVALLVLVGLVRGRRPAPRFRRPT
jgi:hypothetical protein